MIFRGSRCPLYLAPLLGIGLFAQPSQANETFYLNEQAFLTEIPEITSATRLSQRLTESPASISIITRDMISASGARNIPDLMRLVPGFQSFHVSANKFATTYHGASDNFPRRLEVMVDGRSVYLSLLATVDWTSLGLNLADIERVEVVRGSNVPTQGANAFMGSINIITREPAAERGGYVNATAGSMDTRDVHFGHADTLGLWSYRLSGGHEQHDGTELYDDGMKRNYLSISGSYTPTLQETLWLQAGVDSGHTYVGQANREDDPYYRRDHNAHYQSLRYQNLYSDTGTLQLTAYHNYLDLRTPMMSRQYLIDEEGIPEAFVDEYLQLNTLRYDSEHGTSRTFDAEAQLTERGRTLQWVGGLGYRYQSAESDTLLQEGKVSEDRWRLFSNLDWTLHPQWQLNTGFMYEQSSTRSDALSYRQALIFRPDEQSSLRVGYSVSERLASLLERYQNRTIYAPAAFAPPFDQPTVYDYDKAANPDLGTEQSKTYEIGYYLNLPQRDAYLDLRLFQEQMNSIIGGYYLPLLPEEDADTPPRVRISDNRYSWENRGAELQFKHQPTPNFWYLLNYAYINTRVDTWDQGARGANRFVTFEAGVSPEHTASLMLNWKPAPDLNLSLMHYYMDKVDWFEGDLRESYHRTDLRAAQRWALGHDSELEAAVTVQNAFGPTYSEFYRYNLFDRRVWLQLMLRYH